MTLYHYTNAFGLQGILKSKSLWTSDYRFLNDTSEFHYGWDIVTGAIRNFEVDLKAISVEVWLLLESLRSESTRSSVFAFVGSLSTQGDLLSQWRGYNGGKGFSVGINADWLNQNANAQGFSLIPISYKRDEQQTAADKAVRLLLSMLEPDPTRVSEVVTSWWQHALKVALAFKDEHFSEECENRLAYIGQCWPTGVQVRPSSAGLVPYLPCQLDKFMIDNPVFPRNNFGIERIIVGPALREQQIFAVDALLAFHRMKLEVVKSAIPYVSD